MKKHILVALLAGCALVAAGCSKGGDGKETEAKKTVESAAAKETEAPKPAETTAPETEAAVVETEAVAAETEAAVAETEAVAAETEAAVETEAVAAETEAAVETEAVAVETEAAAETETAPAETETERIVVTVPNIETEEETEAEADTETELYDFTQTEPYDFIETESEDLYDYLETELYDYTGTEAETEAETEPIPKPEYEVSDYLEIKDDDYKNITVQVPAAQKATDEEIDAEIRSAFDYLEDYDELVDKKTKGTVKAGDTVNIDYVGTKDGEEFEGGSAEGYDLEIGSGSFIDGFEDGLIGKELGSEVDLNLTFPEDYGVEDLNGADVVFHVTLNYVAQMPELTDELAEKLSGGEYTSVEDYVDSVRAEIQSGYDEEFRNSAYSAIMSRLTELYPVQEFPQENVDYNVENIMSQYIRPYADMYGMSVADFIAAAYNGLTEEEFREQELIPSAKSSLTQEIILSAIAEKENITMTDAELQEILQDYADQYGMPVEDLVGDTDLEMIRDSELQQKVMGWLFENVDIETIEETEAAFGNETEAETEAVSGIETEAETEAASESETKTVPGKAARAETEAETETESGKGAAAGGNKTRR